MPLLIDENAILPTLKSIKIKLNVGITIGLLSLPRLVNNNKNSIRKKVKTQLMHAYAFMHAYINQSGERKYVSN